MLVHGNGFAVGGGAAERVRVELDARGGLPGFALIGLAGARCTRAGAGGGAKQRLRISA
jgi:hypothetical protein